LLSAADWQDLLGSCGYADLLPGGKSGFNATFGGWIDDGDNGARLDDYGYYWSSAASGDNGGYAMFSNISKSAAYVAGADGLPTAFCLSLRYVRDVS